jgi:mannose-6-phosphate isomerase-like protein (cupin superfamily)
LVPWPDRPRLARWTVVDQPFDTMRLPAARDVLAPDGSDVRILLRLAGGSMAHFELAGGQTSRAVLHRSVDEIWYVLRGRGEMWRSRGGAGREGQEATIALEPGTCLSIPVGTRFQFRSLGDGPLSAVAVTMPPWPGEDEAIEVSGAWRPGAAPC